MNIKFTLKISCLFFVFAAHSEATAENLTDKNFTQHYQDSNLIRYAQKKKLPTPAILGQIGNSKIPLDQRIGMIRVLSWPSDQEGLNRHISKTFPKSRSISQSSSYKAVQNLNGEQALITGYIKVRANPKKISPLIVQYFEVATKKLAQSFTAWVIAAEVYGLEALQKNRPCEAWTVPHFMMNDLTLNSDFKPKAANMILSKLAVYASRCNETALKNSSKALAHWISKLKYKRISSKKAAASGDLERNNVGIETPKTSSDVSGESGWLTVTGKCLRPGGIRLFLKDSNGTETRRATRCRKPGRNWQTSFNLRRISSGNLELTAIQGGAVEKRTFNRTLRNPASNK